MEKAPGNPGKVQTGRKNGSLLQPCFQQDPLVSHSDDYAEVPAEVVAVYGQINTPEFQTLHVEVKLQLKDCLIMVIYMYLHQQRPYEMFKQKKGFDIG